MEQLTTRAADARLDFDKMDGLLPAIVQHHESKDILMFGYMNRDAWQKTIETGLVTFWSRTRETLWTKGETSGHVLQVKHMWTDCDSDTILILADPHGPTCHTGRPSCFFEEIVRD